MKKQFDRQRGIMSVSYTHLDVYKRQLPYCLLIVIIVFLFIPYSSVSLTCICAVLRWRISNKIKIAASTKANPSATGPAKRIPSTPKNRGRSRIIGIRKSTCRDRESVAAVSYTHLFLARTLFVLCEQSDLTATRIALFAA